MKNRLGKSFIGTSYLLLIFLSGSWAYFFYLIITKGQILCVEPSRIWLFCEFGISIGVVIYGLILFVNFVKNKGND